MLRALLLWQVTTMNRKTINRIILTAQGFAWLATLVAGFAVLMQWRTLGKPYGFIAWSFSAGIHIICGACIGIGVYGIVAVAFKLRRK